MGPNRDFLATIIHDFPLDIRGIHGAEHWIRVYENGYKLAQITGANVNVILWFSVLHDCQRVNNSRDLSHGPRSASYARKHRKEIDLNDEEFDLLIEAICCHTKGCDRDADITVQTCLDADRLDIGRTGAIVDQAWLYTEAAKTKTMKSKTVTSGRNVK